METNPPDGRPPARQAFLGKLINRLRGNRRVEEDAEDRRGPVVLFSVLLATLIWFMFSMRESYTVVRTLNTQVINIPAGQALQAKPPETVRIQVEGEGWQLLQLYTRPQVVTLNASTPTLDLFESARSSLPVDLRIAEVIPRETTIHLEAQTERRVPVLLEADIRPEPPYDFNRPPRVEPDSVLILGAASLVERIDHWPTVRIERDGVRASFTATLALAEMPERNLVLLSPTATTLFVDVKRFTEVDAELAVRVADLPMGEGPVQLIPNTIQVRYRVPLDQYERAVAAPDLYATVPYDEIRDDRTGWVRPTVNLPDGLVIKDLRMTPGRLQYFIILD